jgi:hypothetical protein
VTLTVFEFENSAKVMVMLILGGTGRLYGAFVGATVYMVLEDYFSKWSPTYWQFGIGLMLVLAVLFARRGVLGVREHRQILLRKEEVMSAALQVEGLNRAFGALPVTRDVNLTLERGARHALIGPNGAGKTTLVNLITGALKPNSGRVVLNGEDITNVSQAERARRGLARTFQINQLFRGLTVLENIGMCISERDGHAHNMWRAVGSSRLFLTRRSTISTRCGWSTTPSSWCANCPMAASGWWRSPLRSRRSRACCCSTSRPPACRLRRAISSSTWWPRSIPTSRC